MNTRPTFLVLFLALSFSLTLFAAPVGATPADPTPAGAIQQVVTLDPEATQISFTLGATGQDVEGKLYLRDGELRLGPEAATASGELTIDVVRAETGHKKRDKTMHKKVLESISHPWIVFRAERIEGTVAATGTSEVSLVGTLTLLGTEHPFTLALSVEVEGERFMARTSFPVPYIEWGLRNPSFAFLRVAKVVDVTIVARGTLTADGATAAASVRSDKP